MLCLAAPDNSPTHKPIRDRKSHRNAQRLRHEVLISRGPDSRHQQAERDIADAPDAHEGMAELLGQRLGGHGEFEAFEVSVWTEAGV